MLLLPLKNLLWLRNTTDTIPLVINTIRKKNYKDAKTQFINASNNAFTKEQKIKAYEMVYTIDEIIGGYDQEEIKYLELLIDTDDTNINYYEDLIVLYQNNDMRTNSAPY